ncbi:YsnF/AvaK domain-containing protein [Pontibacter ruber]|uniref:YsnF/AvaK domain-containing protein n=1 Tax=Pontibacter ruber TaxID=1343895 RepID=A0ABW5D3C9_9BACT|nr:YsnF/AvaK domain-containing protein [Pontibacter ruber]
MRQTVIGIFDYGVDAQMAAQQLMSNGFSADQVDLAVKGAADRAAASNREYANREKDTRVGHFFRSLFSSHHESDKYTKVAEHGSIVTVHARSEEEAKRAADLLDKYGAVDVDERAERLDRTTEEERMHTEADLPRERTIPVTEERLHVGKETVDKGGVRMRSRILERPVEEHLRLREEHLHVERHPVNRPATEKDITNFKEGEIEIVEHAEIPVVNKEARVVEEIDLTRETTEHDETVRDTVRRQDVDIKDLNRDRDLRDPDERRDRNV